MSLQAELLWQHSSCTTAVLQPHRAGSPLCWQDWRARKGTEGLGIAYILCLSQKTDNCNPILKWKCCNYSNKVNVTEAHLMNAASRLMPRVSAVMQGDRNILYRTCKWRILIWWNICIKLTLYIILRRKPSFSRKLQSRLARCESKSWIMASFRHNFDYYVSQCNYRKKPKLHTKALHTVNGKQIVLPQR